MDPLVDILWQSWIVLGQMAPYLLLGFLVAGILSVCVSAAWVERHLGGRGLYPVAAASLFGVPLPLCSCGVIPVTASIRRHGASPAATTSFLISTPQTGVDSIAVTYALLGLPFAIFRPVAAMVTGILGGGLVQWFEPRSEDKATRLASERPQDEPCAEDAGCGGECDVAGDERGGLIARVLHYGFVTLPRDIGPSLLLGVAVAGLIGALVPANALAPWLGGGLGGILLMIAAAIPLYVCATASVPIAVGLIHAGVSPGAALAFLIAGPATNAATVTTLWRIVGRRVTLIYLGTIGLSAVAGGLILNVLLAGSGWVLPLAAGEHAHGHETGGALGHAWAAALLAVLLVSYVWSIRRRRAGVPVPSQPGETGMSEAPPVVALKITGMSCSHCAEAVRRSLTERPDVERADVDLGAGRATVHGRNGGPDAGACVAAVKELGYDAEVAKLT